MKKMLSLVIALTMLLTTAAALADVGDQTNTSALDAFYALTGQSVAAADDKTSAAYLAEVMTGAYAAEPTGETAKTMAAELSGLSQITGKDMAAYASLNKLSVKQVRNAYYKALANVLRAEMMVNPASEEKYKNVQVILGLFLDQSDAADDETRKIIRSSMNRASAKTIADDYQLPEGFVEFIIMNDDWDDDRWDNDDDWKEEALWDDTEDDDDSDDLSLGSKDDKTSTGVAQLQERLIALGYLSGKADGVFGERTKAALQQFQSANGLPSNGVYDDDDEQMMFDMGVVARWDYQDSFDNTPDNTPDNDADNTPDNDADNTPDNAADNSPDKAPVTAPNNTPDTARDDT